MRVSIVKRHKSMEKKIKDDRKRWNQIGEEYRLVEEEEKKIIFVL